MDDEYLKEPKHDVVRYGPDVLEAIRKENNLHNKEDREKAIAIIDKWIKSQDHFMKKDFSKHYIEMCIMTSKGSLERAKIQIDKLCTLKTLLPEFFEPINLEENETKEFLNKGHIAFLPTLTKEYYRILIFKLKPKVILTSSDINFVYKYYTLLAEYCKSYDCCRGYIAIYDFLDTNVSDLVSSLNLVKLQQFNPVLPEGYGLKIKGLYYLTASKVVERFIHFTKEIFSEKIRNRMHTVSSRKSLQDYIDADLPLEYGGTEKSVEELNKDLLKSISDETVQNQLNEMRKAVTDESKRRIDKFNEQYMGMAGTFRTLSLD